MPRPGKADEFRMAELKRPVGWTNVICTEARSPRFRFRRNLRNISSMFRRNIQAQRYGRTSRRSRLRSRSRRVCATSKSAPVDLARRRWPICSGIPAGIATDQRLEERWTGPVGGPARQGRRARLLGVLVRAVSAGNARAMAFHDQFADERPGRDRGSRPLGEFDRGAGRGSHRH